MSEIWQRVLQNALQEVYTETCQWNLELCKSFCVHVKQKRWNGNVFRCTWKWHGLNFGVALPSVYIFRVVSVLTTATALLLQLMQDSGVIHQASTGVFHLLPLGERSLQKLINIVDDEMSKISAQKLLLPLLTLGELWKVTGMTRREQVLTFNTLLVSKRTFTSVLKNTYTTLCTHWHFKSYCFPPLVNIFTMHISTWYLMLNTVIILSVVINSDENIYMCHFKKEKNSQIREKVWSNGHHFR